MSTQQVTDMDSFEKLLPEDIVAHWYPADGRYRRSGRRSPQPGDIAYCGYVKKNPARKPGPADDGIEQCGPCLRLRGLHERP